MFVKTFFDGVILCLKVYYENLLFAIVLMFQAC